jgi:5-formyltetrahydrofolate cyclo-ligase
MTKQDLRTIAKANRTACAGGCPGFATRIAAFACELALPPGAGVAGYAAINDEANPAGLMATLAARGHTLALPRVAAKDAPLVFHAWKPGDALAPGAYGIAEPLSDAPVVIPKILLVPLLAFDAAGYRLGYGGGFYDRTLAQLGDCFAIGIAFAGQEVEAVPHDAHDRRLHAVLTEAGLRRIT